MFGVRCSLASSPFTGLRQQSSRAFQKLAVQALAKSVVPLHVMVGACAADKQKFPKMKDEGTAAAGIEALSAKVSFNVVTAGG